MTEASRNVNLDLGNLAEVNLVSINPAHITHIRLSGSARRDSRQLEIYVSSGLTVTMNFEEIASAESVFAEVVAAIG